MFNWIAGILTGIFFIAFLINWISKNDMEIILENRGYSDITFLGKAPSNICDLNLSYEIIYTEDNIRKTAVACRQVVLK